jgi:hypothetical protein
LRISSARVRFCSENLNGRDGLLVGLLRCYWSHASQSIDLTSAIWAHCRDRWPRGSKEAYHGEGLAEPLGSGGKGSVLGDGQLAQHSAGPCNGRELRRHDWRVSQGMKSERRNDGSSWRGVLRVPGQSASTDYSRLTKTFFVHRKLLCLLTNIDFWNKLLLASYMLILDHDDHLHENMPLKSLWISPVIMADTSSTTSYTFSIR